MERYKFVNYYDYYIDTVTDILMESKEPVYDLLDLPNVSSSKPLSERDEGDKRYIKAEWCVHGQIPKLAQKLVKPDMLTFVEDSVWDRKTKTYSTKIIPHHFANKVNCRHKVEFKDNGDGRTQRIISGFFEVTIPIIGPVFEMAVIGHIKQNAQEDYNISNKALIAYVQKNGDPHADKSFAK